MRFDIISASPQNDTYLQDTIFQELGFKVDWIFTGKTYWVEAKTYNDDLNLYLKDLFRDQVDEKLLFEEANPNSLGFNYLIQVSLKPGVTDNSARSTLNALYYYDSYNEFKVATGHIFLIKTNKDLAMIEEMARKVLCNDLIQRVQIFKNHEVMDYIPSPSLPEVKLTSHTPEIINLNLADIELENLSKEKLWALSLAELKQVQAHFNSPEIQEKRKELGLPESPVDIEMEIIAQTWSEHCKHKIFSANITYTEAEDTRNSLGEMKIEGVFKSFIKKATKDVQEKFKQDWLISVFTDNAGIVRFDDNIDFCLKVETHNSPSALDPYGGALTGILGVNRDILGCGIGAMPIANTNVLCFAPSHYPKEITDKLPPKLRSPLSILRGVHKGIEDGGNKSGIPTVNGAIHFHDNYAGKPLVYCGTVGVLPHKVNGIETYLKRQQAGDNIVICGGSVGADGIHGATFSSLELDDNAPSTAVQIGDPLTQKKLTDFLLLARDKELYNSLTDNGAGGLSSSIGEMAELTNGAEIHLEKIPFKYSGLSPYEIIISESQERMSFSVPDDKLEEFVALAEQMDCNPAVIGKFHNKGSFDIIEQGKLLASLNLKFLHESLVPMELKAHYQETTTEKIWHQNTKTPSIDTLEKTIRSLMAHPNIKSKEALVRQYDHEVKGTTAVKPFIQKRLSGPSDAAVIWTGLYGGDQKGAIAVSCGLNPQSSFLDTYTMTQLSIDEAVRNAVATGANPDYISVCDNYCWPDPIRSANNPDGEHKLAQLVRSGKALYDTAIVYGTPFISGKDSMKNDFIGNNKDNEKIKISVPPTLLITALAKLDSLDDKMTTDFKAEQKLVYYVGPNQFDRNYFSTTHYDLAQLPPVNLPENKSRFHLIHSLIKSKLIESCHDVSEGGIVTAVIESCFPNALGFCFSDNCFKINERMDSFLFNELPAAFIVSIDKSKQAEFEKKAQGNARYIGETNNGQQIKMKNQFDLNINELYQIWSRNEY